MTKLTRWIPDTPEAGGVEPQPAQARIRTCGGMVSASGRFIGDGQGRVCGLDADKQNRQHRQRCWHFPALARPDHPVCRGSAGAAHRVGITSATLTDSRPDNQAEDTKDTEKSKHWQSAIQLTGAQHLAHPAILSSHSSPLTMAQARIFVIQDVARDRAETTASAMSALISASDGRALSLFTSIQRLKACWPYLQTSLSQQNIALYAQHQDRMNLQTLLSCSEMIHVRC